VPAAPSPLHRVRTVLVAEEDPSVLELVTRVLVEGGYDVIRSRDGRAAWGIFLRASSAIDLVLADVVLPGMTGVELVARIAGAMPDLPLVLMSGFGSEDLARRGVVLSHGQVLRKPFTHSELIGIVRRLLPA
jgi:DNA-binding response OmpR family regulator